MNQISQQAFLTREEIVPEAMQELQNCESPNEAARLLSKYGFYFSFAVVVYAVLFPFRFDFTWDHFSKAWSCAVFSPYWDAKTGFRIVPDDVANILLTLPLGFAGFLYFGRKSLPVVRWGLSGLAIGLSAEILQLSIPSRATVLSDAINNGIGALLGAAVAYWVGGRALEFFTGTASERRNIYLWMMICCLVAMLGPYELGPDYSSNIRSGLQMLRTHSHTVESLYGEEWLRMAGFALIGALAARLAVPGRRKRTIKQPISTAALILLLPVVLHSARLLTETNPPSVDELTLNILGAMAGAMASLFIPPAVQALSGLLMITAALIAAGLSPYIFTGWGNAAKFQWIPFYEFCLDRTTSSLYEPILSLVAFAIVGGLFRLSFPKCRQWQIVTYSFGFSAIIESVQRIIPARNAGTGDVLLAAVGAWAGAYVCSAIQSARLNDRIFLNRARDFSSYTM